MSRAGIGVPKSLARYSTRRRLDRSARHLVYHGLAQIFASDYPPLASRARAGPRGARCAAAGAGFSGPAHELRRARLSFARSAWHESTIWRFSCRYSDRFRKPIAGVRGSGAVRQKISARSMALPVYANRFSKIFTRTYFASWFASARGARRAFFVFAATAEKNFHDWLFLRAAGDYNERPFP